MLVHHLHQLHLRDEVSQVFVCGVICGSSAKMGKRLLHTLGRKRSSPTFEHFHRHGGGLVRAVLVDAVGFSPNHLTEAAFPQRLAQR